MIPAMWRCSVIFDETWQRLVNTRYSGTPTRLGTIFYLAKQAGWVDPLKRNPDDEFQAIDGEDGEAKP